MRVNSFSELSVGDHFAAEDADGTPGFYMKHADGGIRYDSIGHKDGLLRLCPRECVPFDPRRSVVKIEVPTIAGYGRRRPTAVLAQ